MLYEVITNIPIGKRAGKAYVNQIEATIEREKLRLDQIEQSLFLNVRQAWRSYNVSLEKLDAARLVITSYSIHYTKLYESVFLTHTHHQTTHGHQRSCGKTKLFRSKHRITSYNVCYTKLLRKFKKW